MSAEIETLQSRSTALNTQLENRRVVEKLLGPAVEEVSISPAVITKLCESSIDHTWSKALEALEKRLKTIDSKLHGSENILAASDLKPILEDLTNLVLDPLYPFLDCLGLISWGRLLSEYVISSSLRSSL